MIRIRRCDRLFKVRSSLRPLRRHCESVDHCHFRTARNIFDSGCFLVDWNDLAGRHVQQVRYPELGARIVAFLGASYLLLALIVRRLRNR
jgi:hypothetical protein